MAFNKVILVGNLVGDPELKVTTGGVNVTSFRIAVNRRFAKNGEPDFFEIVAWRQTAEFICKHFSKGSPILVSGSLQNRSWTDSDGNKRYATEVVADEVSFVGKKESVTPAQLDVPTYGGAMSGYEELSADDTLPF